MEKRKKYFLKERFLQSRRAFLLLEALICLLLFSFALCLFLRFNSIPKTIPPLVTKSPLHHPQYFKTSQILILKSGNLEFEANQKIWDDGEQRFIILEDLR